MTDNSTNYYKVLGVNQNSTLDEIKIAYRKLSKKFHPDVNGGDQFFVEKFKELQEAYEKLTNVSFKEQYDKQFKQTNNYEMGQKDNAHSNTTTDDSTTTGVHSTNDKHLNKRRSNFSIVLRITIAVITCVVFIFIQTHKKSTYAVNNRSAYNEASNKANDSPQSPPQIAEQPIIQKDVDSINNNLQSTVNDVEEAAKLATNNNINQSPGLGNTTKDETQNWILDKFNKYSKENTNRISEFGGTASLSNSTWITYFNYRFEFIGDYFKVTYDYARSQYQDTVKNEITKILIFDFKKLYSKYGEISIFNNDNTIIDLDPKTEAQRVSSVFSIGFNTDAETDLPQRIEKAFIHLKQFYSKPISTEPF